MAFFRPVFAPLSRSLGAVRSWPRAPVAAPLSTHACPAFAFPSPLRAARVHQCSMLCPCHSRILAVRAFATDSKPFDSVAQRIKEFIKSDNLEENQRPLIEVLTGLTSQRVFEGTHTALALSGGILFLNFFVGHISFATPLVELAFTGLLFPHLWIGLESISNDYVPPSLRPYAAILVLVITVALVVKMLSSIVGGSGIIETFRAFFQHPLDEKTLEALEKSKHAKH